jgi:hypothetical protein
MTNPIDFVLGQLDGVVRAGKAFKALCPAHGDKTPSLSVKEGDDGRVLMHCFAGCSTDAVIAALGLNMSDLFVANTNQRLVPRVLGVNARELNAASEHEMCILYFVKADQQAGKKISDLDSQRAMLAVNRISKARRLR